MEYVTVLTIPDVFEHRVAETPEEQALLLANPDGQFQPYSWTRIAEDVYLWTDALHRLGLQSGQAVAHWSDNRYEWIIADLAIQMLGAIHLPLHATLSDAQAVQQTIHGGARMALVSQRKQGNVLLKKVRQVNEKFRVVTLDTPAAIGSFTASASVERGREVAVEQRATISPDDFATILYSSGTTGSPKGVALTHANIVFNCTASLAAFGEQASDTRLNFLPFSHIYARTCDLYTWMARGSQLALARSRDTIMEDVRSIRPTLINGVPYFYQRIHHKLMESGKADDPEALRATLGGEIRACVCGGAALDDATYDFYHERGIPLLPGYGLTETSPVIATCTLDAARRGTVGQPIPGVEVRIAADGEIQTRGPHVMRMYWADVAATEEAFSAGDGWFSTGDLGQLSDDGYLSITGRKKEMYAMATGKNVYPTQIESRLCRDPMIHQACVIGDQRNYLTALIVPEEDAIRSWIRKQRLWVISKQHAVRHRKVRKRYRQAISQQLKDLASNEQIQEFTILDRGFTQESGHLTPKLSLARYLILKDFAPQIEAMYAQKKRQKRRQKKRPE